MGIMRKLAVLAILLFAIAVWPKRAFALPLFLLLSFSALAVLVVMFWPDSAARVAQTIVGQPVLSGGIGLMALIVVLPVLLVLAITIILSPVSFLGFLILAIATVFGWISLGLEVGRRLAQMFHREWAPGVAAGVGTFLFTFVTYCVEYFLGFIPCIGWLLPFVVGLTSLGAVMLSRFGIRSYGWETAAEVVKGFPKKQGV